jgi:iron complex transport system ATP-binding protein
VTLELVDLGFAYDDGTVLDGVDLSVSDGEVVGLVGPNGSGKSTLLQCATGILEPDRGRVVVDGDAAATLGRQERARRIGYVPQTESNAFPATVFDTILLGRRPHGGWSPSREDREAVAAVIDRLGLEPFTSRRVSELSGGQRQTVRLGRALVQDPSVLLLDEPTSALDLKHQLAVMELLTGHAREASVATVVAIHDLNLATRFCDRIAILDGGELYDVGGPEVLTPEAIGEVYGVAVDVRTHQGRRLVVPDRPVDGLPSDGVGGQSSDDDGESSHDLTTPPVD